MAFLRTRNSLHAEQTSLLQKSLALFRAGFESPLWVAVTLVLLGFAIHRNLVHFPFNVDMSNSLDYVQRMFMGERLYVDIVDPNPPLTFYLLFPVVAAAKWLDADVFKLTTSWYASMNVLSLGLTYFVCEKYRLFQTRMHLRIFFWIAVYAFFVLPWSDFAQRDPMAVVLSFPYLFLAAARAKGERISLPLALAAGFLAGTGIALKPFFVAILLFTEAYIYFQNKSLKSLVSALPLTIIAINLVYAIWVLSGTDFPVMVRYVASTYSSYALSLEAAIANAKPILWVATLAASLLIRPVVADRAVRAILLFTMLAMTYSATVQMKGWPYHWLPVHMLYVLLWGILVLDVFENESLRSRLRIDLRFLTPLFSVGILTLSLMPARSIGEPAIQTFEYLASIVRQEAQGKRVAWLTTYLSPGFPTIVAGGANSALRFNALWMLPGEYANVDPAATPFPYHAPSEMSEFETFTIDSVVEDIRKHRPVLIIDDRRPNKQGFGPSGFDETTFEFLAFFLRDPRFATEFANYQFLVDVGPLRFYKRKGS